MANDKLVSMLVREMKRTENISARDEYRAYDDMDAMRWSLPSPLDKMPEMRIDIDSSPHDHLKTGCDIFNTHTPNIEIQPRGPADKDLAKDLSVWAEWQIAQSNQRGRGDFTRKLLEDALKYMRVCARVDYLPYWLPEESMRTKEQKAMAAVGGDFCIEIFHPSAIYAGTGNYGLSWVANIQCLPAAEVAEHWGLYVSNKHPTIKSAVAKLQELEDNYVGVVDVTSYDRRLVFAMDVGSMMKEITAELVENSERITILNGENPLSFINWSVVQGRDDPILAPLHRSGLWNNQNLIQSISTSTTIKLAMPPPIIHTKIGNKPLEVTYDGTQASYEADAAIGERIENFPPRPLDQNFLELMSRNSNRMGTQTGLRNLNNVDPVGNIQYATLDAFISLSMTRLQPAVRVAEKALAQIIQIMFLWVKDRNAVSRAYRTKKGKMQGGQIDLDADKFDPKALFVKAEFAQNKPTNKMQEVTMYATLKQAGAPLAWGYILDEKLDLGVNEVLAGNYEDEEIMLLALETFKQKKLLDIQVQSQAAMGAMQASAQPGAQSPEMSQTPPPFDQMQGQASNPATGGTPPAMGAPQLTQTQIPPGGA